MRFSFVPFLLLIVPLMEIAVFVIVGSGIGVLPTIGAVILTAILGSILLRQQGLGILQRLQKETQSGHIPGRELVHGAMIMIAGVLLLTPGFVTDSLGFLLFVPPLRDLAWNFLKTRIHMTPMSGFHSRTGFSNHGDNVVDLGEDEYSRQERSDGPSSDSPWSGKSNDGQSLTDDSKS